MMISCSVENDRDWFWIDLNFVRPISHLLFLLGVFFTYMAAIRIENSAMQSQQPQTRPTFQLEVELRRRYRLRSTILLCSPCVFDFWFVLTKENYYRRQRLQIRVLSIEGYSLYLKSRGMQFSMSPRVLHFYELHLPLLVSEYYLIVCYRKQLEVQSNNPGFRRKGFLIQSADNIK